MLGHAIFVHFRYNFLDPLRQDFLHAAGSYSRSIFLCSDISRIEIFACGGMQDLPRWGDDMRGAENNFLHVLVTGGCGFIGSHGAMQQVGWQPRTDLPTGFTRSFEWIRENESEIRSRYVS